MARCGETALDEPVAALLPAGTRVPDRNGKPITLLQLAAHTSGLPRVPANLPVSSPEPYAGYTPERLYAFLAECQLARTPGEGFEYSNLGADLLGHALGLRAGQSYEGLLGNRILQPLGMTSTAIHLPPALAARFASAHDDSGDRLMVQLTGQAALRVFPLSEWEFFYKVVGAQITFEPGPDGRTAWLILHQNSRDQTADRIEG